jgi:2-polyprenyl-3-methyl-5-hydroxy-6-metoxy-1,4-benzoquinol methylase
LEIGCGIGTVTQLLIRYLRNGFLYSCDIADENIKTVQNFLGHYKNLSLKVKDATDFCLDMEFDVIIMPDVIEHIPITYHAKMFKNLAKMLKQTGFIYIHIPNPYYLEWANIFRKETLQIIDQPIYLSDFVQNINNTDLYIFYEKSYSLWEGTEYTHRVLKKKPLLNENSYFPIKEKYKLLFRIKRKFRRILKNWLYDVYHSL